METTALAEFVLKGQALPKKVRLEDDLMCSEGTGEGHMQDLEALFEQCKEIACSSGGVIPRQAVSQASPTIIPAPLPFPAPSPQFIARRNDPAAADGDISPHVLPSTSKGLSPPELHEYQDVDISFMLQGLSTPWISRHTGILAT